ncbi:HNH endonuclease, partial [Salmonella enterica]|uniref:HNH endonuclease n=1 Tax=Salmonella enterica TaxID=28901 RepID=UPI000CBCEEEB
RRMVTPNENMRVFRRKVYERDEYTCVVCGDKSRKKHGLKLNAHHLNGHHWYKEGRFDSDNGVTLCSSCHDNFHEKYGKKNNTKEQFEEFHKQQLQHT